MLRRVVCPHTAKSGSRALHSLVALPHTHAPHTPKCSSFAPLSTHLNSAQMQRSSFVRSRWLCSSASEPQKLWETVKTDEDALRVLEEVWNRTANVENLQPLAIDGTLDWVLNMLENGRETQQITLGCIGILDNFVAKCKTAPDLIADADGNEMDDAEFEVEALQRQTSASGPDFDLSLALVEKGALELVCDAVLASLPTEEYEEFSLVVAHLLSVLVPAFPIERIADGTTTINKAVDIMMSLLRAWPESENITYFAGGTLMIALYHNKSCEYFLNKHQEEFLELLVQHPYQHSISSAVWAVLGAAVQFETNQANIKKWLITTAQVLVLPETSAETPAPSMEDQTTLLSGASTLLLVAFNDKSLVQHFHDAGGIKEMTRIITTTPAPLIATLDRTQVECFAQMIELSSQLSVVARELSNKELIAQIVVMVEAFPDSKVVLNCAHHTFANLRRVGKAETKALIEQHTTLAFRLCSILLSEDELLELSDNELEHDQLTAVYNIINDFKAIKQQGGKARKNLARAEDIQAAMAVAEGLGTDVSILAAVAKLLVEMAKMGREREMLTLAVVPRMEALASALGVEVGAKEGRKGGGGGVSEAEVRSLRLSLQSLDEAVQKGAKELEAEAERQ